MNLHEILYKELNENGILREELRELVEKTVTKTVKNGEDGGGLVSKDTVMDYMREKGMQPTQKNFEYAYRYLSGKLQNVAEDGMLQMTLREQEYINHLGEFSDEDMRALIDICILRELREIERRMSNEQQYEYKVESLHDENGMTSTWELSQLISKYAEQGYQLKNIFVNELGKNALAIGGIGVNTTADQVVIIFERPKIRRL